MRRERKTDEVADGEVVRTRLLVKDSLRDHQPGYRDYLPDAADAAQRRKEARDAYIKRTCDAWRNPYPLRDAPEPDAGTELLRRHMRTEPDGDDGDSAQAQKDAAYEAYKNRLQTAWQSVEQARKRVTAEV
jgi:hypothetical protein